MGVLIDYECDDPVSPALSFPRVLNLEALSLHGILLVVGVGVKAGVFHVGRFAARRWQK